MMRKTNMFIDFQRREARLTYPVVLPINFEDAVKEVYRALAGNFISDFRVYLLIAKSQLTLYYIRADMIPEQERTIDLDVVFSKYVCKVDVVDTEDKYLAERLKGLGFVTPLYSSNCLMVKIEDTQKPRYFTFRKYYYKGEVWFVQPIYRWDWKRLGFIVKSRNELSEVFSGCSIEWVE